MKLILLVCIAILANAPRIAHGQGPKVGFGSAPPKCPGEMCGPGDQLKYGPFFSDNHDGTVTDIRTGLTWEKLSDDGTIHDVDNTYTWEDAAAKIERLNGVSFAGHKDWRLPNLAELGTMASVAIWDELPSESDQLVDEIFDKDCKPGCSNLACSCVHGRVYWLLSSTSPRGETSAQCAEFYVSGNVGVDLLARVRSLGSCPAKGAGVTARAVRGKLSSK